MAKAFAYQILRAPKDVAGHQRALWIVFGELGEVLRVIVDGTKVGTLPAPCQGLEQLPTMVVPASYFTAWINLGLRLGVLEHA